MKFSRFNKKPTILECLAAFFALVALFTALTSEAQSKNCERCEEFRALRQHLLSLKVGSDQPGVPDETKLNRFRDYFYNEKNSKKWISPNRNPKETVEIIQVLAAATPFDDEASLADHLASLLRKSPTLRQDFKAALPLIETCRRKFFVEAVKEKSCQLNEPPSQDSPSNACDSQEPPVDIEECLAAANKPKAKKK